jgi:hypothetical protein
MEAGRPLGLLMAAPLIAVAGVRGGFAVCGVCMATVTLVGRTGLLGPVAHHDSDGLEPTDSPVIAGS